ncbi:hypothetical protein JCM17823_23050 [Halorubrum gandharaense]
MTNVTTSRRSLLAGLGVAASSAGCVGRVRNIAGRDSASQLTLELMTTPADADPHGIRIARHLSEHLEAVGIATRVNTVSEADLHRNVLLNHDYDVYVGQFSEAEPFDPDALYSLLHSRFAEETGWQNPFGLTELAIDEMLDEQRSVPESGRPGVVSELLETVAEVQPFNVVAFPDALTAVREGNFEGWETGRPTSASGLLQLEHAGEVDDDEPVTLGLATTDDRITENLNPIAAEYRRHGTFTDLLYDPLVRSDSGNRIPWLAADWTWDGDTDTLRVTLREANWHDGEPVTAEDMAFTYEFLADTSLGEAETPVPAPKYRGRSSLVESSRVIDDRTVELSLVSSSETVAQRLLEVPVLPAHIWSDLTAPATIVGIEIDEEATEAVVWNNEEPVGSGPLVFEESTAESEVTFHANEEHFLRQDPESTPGGIPPAYAGGPAYERMVIEVVPSDIAAVQAVGDGLADATASNLGPDAVPRIGREASAKLVSARSAAFYHVGYNVRQTPLSNPRFRGILSGLLDKQAIAEETFQGYAAPAATPLAPSPQWVPSSLQWDDETGTDPKHPFYSENGELDADRVREELRDAGYRYNEAGELLARGQ